MARRIFVGLFVSVLAATGFLVVGLASVGLDSVDEAQAGATVEWRGRGLGRVELDEIIEPEAFDGGIESSIAPPAAALADAGTVRSVASLGPSPYADVTPAPGPWVVTIGINDYPGRRADLRYSRNDVDDMDEAMARLGVPASRRLSLRDATATSGHITSSIRWLAAHAAPESTAVFMFAGHVRNQGGGVHALVGSDGVAVPDHVVAELMAGVRAGRIWVVIAGCYGAGFDEVVRPGVVLTAAAAADQLAYENSAYERSYLAEFVIRRGLLGGNGGDSVESVFAWVRDELARERPNRVPVQLDALSGELALAQIAAGAPAARPTATAPATPEERPPPPPPSPRRSTRLTPTAPRPGSHDDCANLTVGVVSCD